MMRCGIEVLKRLNDISDFKLDQLIIQAEEKLNKQGLNFYDLYELLKNNGYQIEAVASLSADLPCPYIAFIGNQKMGHYVLVEQVKPKVQIFDPASGLREWRYLTFFLYWSHKAIVFIHQK